MVLEALVDFMDNYYEVLVKPYSTIQPLPFLQAINIIYSANLDHPSLKYLVYIETSWETRNFRIPQAEEEAWWCYFMTFCVRFNEL